MPDSSGEILLAAQIKFSPTKRSRDETFNTLTEYEKKIFWKGYDKGYRVGSQRDKVTALETQLINLKVQLATLQNTRRLV